MAEKENSAPGLAFNRMNRESGETKMDRVNLEKYQVSMMMVLSLFKQGIIDEKDYKKSESFLAKKYCINKDNLYRLNNLICTPERVINICEESKGICYAN